MPMFTPCAIGESLWPKHTGHASATRGTASISAASSALPPHSSHRYRFLVFRWNAAP